MIISLRLNKFKEKFVFRSIFTIISLFGVYYLYRASQYSIPLGHDGVIYVWPVGQFMAQSTLKEFFTALSSSFLGEDHLSPIYHLYGYFCYLLSSNPTFILNITAKLYYLFIIIISLLVVFNLWKDRMRLLILFLLLVFNLSLFWQNLISVNLSIIPPLFCLYFINRFIQNKKRSDLIFFSLFFFILSFSFETAFIGIPLIAIYIMFSVWNKQDPSSDKIKSIFKVYLIMFFLFLPYMIIHYQLYGTLIPVSRTSLFAEGSRLIYYIKMLFLLLSDWSFGLGRLLFERAPIIMVAILPILVLFVISVYKFKLLSKIGVYIFYAFLFQLICILYTGRHSPGQWTLVGIVYCIILTDIISRIISKLGKNKDYLFIQKASYIFIIFAIPFLFLINKVVNPLKKAELEFGNPHKSSHAAYKAINEPADRIIIVRLPDGEELMHPIAFWIGNKIYHNEPGLWIYPKYNQLLPKNMNIEHYENKESDEFEYYKSFLSPEPDNKEVVVFKDRNLYARIYLNSNDKKILRAAVIPYAPQDFFSINFPDLVKYNNDISKLQINLTFTCLASNIKSITYGGKEIKNWNAYENRISFFSDNLSLKNNLIVESNTNSSILELIEVNLPTNYQKNLENSNNMTRKKIFLTTENSPCRYFINTPTQGEDFIVGTLDAGKKISLFTLLSESEFEESFELTYTSFETNRKKRKVGKLILPDFSKRELPLFICCPEYGEEKNVTEGRN